MRYFKSFLRGLIFGLISPLWAITLLVAYIIGYGIRVIEWLGDAKKDNYAFVPAKEIFSVLKWVIGTKD